EPADDAAGRDPLGGVAGDVGRPAVWQAAAAQRRLDLVLAEAGAEEDVVAGRPRLAEPGGDVERRPESGAGGGRRRGEELLERGLAQDPAVHDAVERDAAGDAEAAQAGRALQVAGDVQT